MSILGGKRPVHFVKYQRYTLFHRGGFVFEEGLGNRFRLNSVQLGNLLGARDEHGNRLAYLVVDEKLWEATVTHARGKKTKEESELARLKAKKKETENELERIKKELEAKKRRLPKSVPRDPKDAARAANEAAAAYKEISALQQRGAKLQEELQHIEHDLAKHEKR